MAISIAISDATSPSSFQTFGGSTVYVCIAMYFFMVKNLSGFAANAVCEQLEQRSTLSAIVKHAIMLPERQIATAQGLPRDFLAAIWLTIGAVLASRCMQCTPFPLSPSNRQSLSDRQPDSVVSPDSQRRIRAGSLMNGRAMAT